MIAGNRASPDKLVRMAVTGRLDPTAKARKDIDTAILK